MVYYKFGRCTVCQFRLRPDNVFTLKNCNHRECVTRWITEGSKTCPRCRDPATLNDIKQLFVEEAGDSSDDSGDELIQSSSNLSTKNENTNDLFDKNMTDLTIKLNNLPNKFANFVEIKNKWGELYFFRCCKNNCINTFEPNNKCIEGSGFVNLIDDENIKYISTLKNKSFDRIPNVYAENSFNKPQSCLNYSLYYLEVKCIFERLDSKENWMTFGFEDCSTGGCIRIMPALSMIEENKHSTFSWDNNDIFGCGIVYPPTNKLNEEFPYIFFTKNGKQIGKAILLKENYDTCRPFLILKCCSIETNFGNNLETIPFKYDISTHLVVKEFY
uniref:Uncharacterized protein n=1 Tax=Meloidogyne enterolobii TaxID=390850 RepID=A0A6V7VNG2_MELEN|nr:unnamed protein product [Meloidogyne enterolobii]